jgi:light-regulated signal transduction histidine kinase (bacteriophytochrome)
MSDRIDRLGRDYVSALGAYIQNRDEPTLSFAYELGRRAMFDGCGVLDMALLHRGAVRDLVVPAPQREQARFADAAAEFFNELLAPFEMSFRGYRAANADLQSLNETLRQQKEAVERVNAELESFSYSVSHDLRAPLRSIDGFSKILLEDFADSLDEKGKAYLDRVRAASKHMAQLIDGLLELSRVSRAEIHRADVDLTALVQRIADGLRRARPERDAILAIEEGVEANGDARLLAVLFENLLNNAWKFTSKRERAEIWFGREERGGVATYFVRDNGAGFDMAHAAKLFGAFQRLHTVAEFDGTGIGLATVRRVVARHGGRVWAEAKVDGGATFYFTLGGGSRG